MEQSKPRICVVGSSVVDLIARTPRFPEAGETLIGSSFQIGFGGKGSNQAVMAARLGADVSMVVKLGRDVFGENTLQNYQENGIRTDFVFFDDVLFSGVAPISVDEATGQNAIVIIPGANMGLSPEDVHRASGVIQSAEVVICQLEIPLETTIEAFRIAVKSGVKTILNPAPAAQIPEELMQLTDICIPNETETQILTGLTVDSPDSAIAAGRTILARGPQSVIITLGEMGAVRVSRGEEDYFPAERVQPVDSTGAGDAFVGCLAFQLARGYQIGKAITSACAVATQTVLKTGTQTSYPTYDEVWRFLED